MSNEGLVHCIRFKISSVGCAARLLVSAERNYTVSDVQVEERVSKDGHQFWRKTLALTAEWTIGAHVKRNAPEGGFGIYVEFVAAPRSFSWNWFTRESPGVYRHIQCGARVNADFRQVDNGSELRQVEFIDDTTLSFQTDVMHQSQDDTHEMVLLKGSILRISD